MLSKFWDPQTARVISTALVFALALAFLYGASETITLFLVAILFAYFVDPAVSRLEKPLRGRTQAIAAVYLGLAAVLIGLGFLIGPRIAEEGKSLATNLPTFLDQLGSGQLVSQVGQAHGLSEARLEQIQGFFVAHRNDLLSFGRAIGSRLAEPAQHIWWLILVPILSLFFLKDGGTIADGLIELGRTSEEKSTLKGIVLDVNVMLGSYIRAQLILAGLTLITFSIVLSILRVPYAFILGPIAGIFEFVPVLGPALAAVTIILIAVLTGYPHVILLVLFLVIWRLMQDYVTGPRVMGKTMRISPLVQIFAVLAGGEIAGVIGALISVPVVAFLRILARRLTSGKGIDEPISPAIVAAPRPMIPRFRRAKVSRP